MRADQRRVTMHTPTCLDVTKYNRLHQIVKSVNAIGILINIIISRCLTIDVVPGLLPGIHTAQHVVDVFKTLLLEKLSGLGAAVA